MSIPKTNVRGLQNVRTHSGKVDQIMEKKASQQKGKYLYAVIEGTDNRTYGEIGINSGLVYLIPNGRISAVVSDVPNQKLRPERRQLAAHQEVLKRLMEECTPLPMSFGIIAEGSKAVQKILTRNQKEFIKELHRVNGKVEMGLRVTLDVPNIFDYFVSTHPELRSARDRFFGSKREPSQEDKIELGRMFGRMLNEDRETHTEKVEEVLSRYCSEIKRNLCRKEADVMNLACLVERKAGKQFEEGILEAANLFDNNFAFDFNGPWAPHNFVEIDLEF